MDRNQLLARLDRPPNEPWDLLIIGGGAVGMGVALDAVSRGHSCVLFEQHDFCKATSSRSTKLIHGGVRYLAQGNISLVREALHERGLLMRNASSLVQPLRFVVPCYSASERWYYWAGMKCYDALAGQLGIAPSRQISTDELAASISGLRTDGLHGGVAYFDAQFDDARLVIATAKKVHQLGGLPLNYMRVTDLIRERGRIGGVCVQDTETDTSYVVRARVVVNAGGAFSDTIRRMESPSAPEMISPSQGIHLVVDQQFLGGKDAIMIPKTKDGRVLFAIPWLGRVILGTTDTPVPRAELEPRALDQEVDYLLEHFAEYLSPAPSRQHVLSVFAGLRPLVRPKREAGSTAKISREHCIMRSSGGLVSVLGGKWTTFRKMGEDVVDVAEEVGPLAHRATRTRELELAISPGSVAEAPDAQPTATQIVAAARGEFARTVEDVLARRFRCLLLDARRSIDWAPDVAQVLSEALGKSADWQRTQTQAYSELAARYLLED